MLNIWFQQRGGNYKKESNSNSKNKNTATEMKHAFDRVIKTLMQSRKESVNLKRSIEIIQIETKRKNNRKFKRHEKIVNVLS